MSDVYVSYAKEDTDWVRELVEEIEQNGLSVCWDVRDFDPNDSLNENRSNFVEKCSSCVLVFSRSYCKRASEWSYFTKFIKKSKEETKSVTTLLENKSIVCVYLSECNVPTLFSKQKMLDWTEIEFSDIFWERLLKFLKSAKKKADVKRVLYSKLKNVKVNKEKDDTSNIEENNEDRIKVKNEIKNSQNLEINQIDCKRKTKLIDSEVEIMLIDSKVESIAEKTKQMYQESDEKYFGKFDKENNEIINNKEEERDYENTKTEKDKNSSDKEEEEGDEDEDESNQNSDTEVDAKFNSLNNYEMFNVVYPHLISSSFCAEDEDLTKEDIENLTFKVEEVETILLLNEKSPEKFMSSFHTDDEVKKQLSEFDSQHEQMQLLDVLQSLQERAQSVMDRLNSGNDPKKKRYRRLLQRYQNCIMKVVNGRKDTLLIQSLPLVSQYLSEMEDREWCYCCNNLYHSKRALELHLELCVKETWKELMKRKDKK